MGSPLVLTLELLQTSSVRPPHGLLQPRRAGHVGGGVAVAPFGLHHVALVGQVGVEQRGARGGVGAGRVDARRGPVAPGDHGELIGAGGGAVVQVVGGGAGLEGAALSLGGAGVGRGEVRVVSGGRGHGRHADADAGADGRGRVGEGSRVVHAGVGDGRERREGAVDSHPGVAERSQVRGTCVVRKGGREMLTESQDPRRN